MKYQVSPMGPNLMPSSIGNLTRPKNGSVPWLVSVKPAFILPPPARVSLTKPLRSTSPSLYSRTTEIPSSNVFVSTTFQLFDPIHASFGLTANIPDLSRATCLSAGAPRLSNFKPFLISNLAVILPSERTARLSAMDISPLLADEGMLLLTAGYQASGPPSTSAGSGEIDLSRLQVSATKAKEDLYVLSWKANFWRTFPAAGW